MTPQTIKQSILEELKEAYLSRGNSTRRYRDSASKVLGYLCDNVPEELVLAAGFQPLRLAGDSARSTDHLERQVLPYIASDKSRLAWTDSIVDRLLAGDYAELDYLVIPHNRHAVQSIYHELIAAQEKFSDLQLPELWFLDLTWSPGEASRRFNRHSILNFRQQLETWSGKSIGRQELDEAVGLCNENRQLLRRVAELRNAEPPLVSGVQALQILGSSAFVPKARHNELLNALLEVSETLDAHPGPRIFVGGSPLDHSRLYEAIENCGAVVVAEDHCWGERLADGSLRADIDPLEAMAERFHQQPACSIRFPLEDTIAVSTRRALSARADAAIFYCMAGDRAQVWETPDAIQQLAAEGIPSLHLKEQDYTVDDPAMQASLRDFIHARL